MLKRATTKCYLVPIQSFSDIITNSSSETYIVDTSYTAKALEEALEAVHKEHEDEEYYSGECCGIEVSLEPTLHMEDNIITLWLPYGEYAVEFYKEGLEAILDKYFKDNYKIEYE